jgi:hypothetical protein
LRGHGLDVTGGDFLQVAKAYRGTVDRVVMNPPFAKQKDIDHATVAFDCLAPGGKLVAILSAGVEFRQDKKAKAFRGLVDSARGTIERIADGAFKESGTMVRTVLVTLHR